MLKKLLLRMGACLSIAVFFVCLSFQGTAYAKNTSIHVHIKGDTDQVISVSVMYKDRYIKLKQKSTKLYSEYKKLAGTAEIVKDDISKIIVTTVEGTQYFEPAINYAGEEGNGTINYWIEIKSGSGDGGSEDNSTGKTDDSNYDKEGSDGKTVDNDNSTSADDKKDTDSKTPTTVTGGKLPATSTPWYNYLLISGLIALSSGGVILISKRLTK